MEQSPIGKVFIPRADVDIVGDIGIRYEKHPWIEQFEFDGMRPRTPRRQGYGTKTIRAFTESLSTIYAKAYDDYAAMCCEECATEDNKDGLNIDRYYFNVATYFVRFAETQERIPLYRKFCGFTENMWREGTKTMYDIVMGTVLPVIESSPVAANIFYDTITSEFREYIEEHYYGKKEN